MRPGRSFTLVVLVSLAASVTATIVAYGDDSEPPSAPAQTSEPDNPYEPPEPKPSAEPGETRAPGETRHAPRYHVPLEDGMFHVPGGTFTMGREGPGTEPNERPPHSVKLSPFWIDRTEVTVAALRTCITQGKCGEPPTHSTACTIGRADGSLPVNCISWEGADAYCRAVGKRLPTEAEWEFAARGVTPLRFPWGAKAPNCAVVVTLINNRSGVSCSPTGPLPVASHPQNASPYGALDMAGNVEEWVADWYADRYEATGATPIDSPRGPAFGVAHVLRGGGWMSRPRDVAVAVRNWGSANEAGPNVGFRCAKD